MKNLLFHGGVAGLRCGDRILPNMAEHRYVEGCAHCDAQRDGVASSGFDPATPEGWVYASSDREYARYYASRAVGGTLYRVRLEGDVEPSLEDPFPSWRGRSAVVVEVLATKVQLTNSQRLRLFLRWGGTEAEFKAMVDTMTKGAA